MNGGRKNILEGAQASPIDHAEIKTKGGGQPLLLPIHTSPPPPPTTYRGFCLHTAEWTAKALGTKYRNSVHIKRTGVFILKGQIRKGGWES